MHFLCTICSDLLDQAENIFVTKCGHMFHYHCLSQWIERSQSCPQCRHRVTNKCMFRLYPTISNENGDDATTLQARLDDAQLQLRQQRTKLKEHDDKTASLTAELKKNEELLKACEKKLVSRESAVSALKEQLEYVKIQNKDTQRLKEENEGLKKNIQTLNGLQKVLNATSQEVENMLQVYTDVRTIATFATALKRALCESEARKSESRDRLQATQNQLAIEKSNIADLQAKLKQMEEKVWNAECKYQTLKNKMRVPEPEPVKIKTPSEDTPWAIVEKQLLPCDVYRPPDEFSKTFIMSDNNTSFDHMLNNIQNSDSPYLMLKQSNLALNALQRAPSAVIPDSKLKPSEFALFNAASKVARKNNTENIQQNQKLLSIFHKKEPAKFGGFQENELNAAKLDVSYDGLGGHSKLDTFPVPKSCVPKLTAKHKLKRPAPSGSQDIGKIFGKKRLNDS